MKLPKLFSVLPLILISLVVCLSFVFSGCSKKCSIKTKDLDSGQILPATILYNFPAEGTRYINQQPDSSGLVYQYSQNQGYSRQAINFDVYTAISFPVSTGCSAALHRFVSVNLTTKVVLYHIIIEECIDCKGVRIQQNWVLVPKFNPDDFTVIYKTERK
jgi:hypothetical protein